MIEITVYSKAKYIRPTPKIFSNGLISENVVISSFFSFIVLKNLSSSHNIFFKLLISKFQANYQDTICMYKTVAKKKHSIKVE